MTMQSKQSGTQTDQASLSALAFAGQLGFIIAIPAFLFGFGGAYLDKYWGTSPTFLLLGFMIAIFTSGFAAYRSIKKILYP